MTFENEIDKMQDIFHYTDKEFNELSYLIPLDNIDETYSPRLYSILQSTCGQIENMCRILCEKLDLNPNCDHFPCYYDSLDIGGMLEVQYVYLIRKNLVLQPFLIKSEKTPEWWKNYNDTKHKLPEGLKQGNLGNTVLALSALYYLHRIAFYVRFEETPRRVLCKRFWQTTWLVDTRDSFTRRSHLSEPIGMAFSETFSPISFYNAEGANI